MLIQTRLQISLNIWSQVNKTNFHLEKSDSNRDIDTLTSKNRFFSIANGENASEEYKLLHFGTILLLILSRKFLGRSPLRRKWDAGEPCKKKNSPSQRFFSIFFLKKMIRTILSKHAINKKTLSAIRSFG